MRLVRRLLIACCLTVVGLVCLAACGGRADALREIRDRGVLRIGMDPSYLPFEALAPDGGLYGLDVDLGRELASRLGVEPAFVFAGYDGLYHALEVKEVDMLLSALVVEDGRLEDVGYTTPYVDAGLVLVAPAAEEGIKEMRDLAGGAVAVEVASEGDAEARRWSRRLGDLTVLPLDTPDEAMAAVLAGRAQAALVDGVSARLYLRQQKGLVLAPSLMTSQPYAAAVRSEDRSLLQALDEALAAMAADGTLQVILHRWL